MIISLDAKAGQTVEEFCLELENFARRLDCTILANFNGTQFVATAGDRASLLAEIYYSTRKRMIPV